MMPTPRPTSLTCEAQANEGGLELYGISGGQILGSISIGSYIEVR